MAEPSRPSPVRTPEVFDGARSVEYDPDDDIYLVFYADGTAKAWAERSYGFWLEVPIPTDRPNAD